MPTAASILADLKSKGKENTRKIYARHGMAADRVYGVSVAEMKAIAKTIKKQQDLALDLYASGIMDAMYLAGMVADGSQMTPKQINDWAEGAAHLQMIAEYTVPWVTVENPHSLDLALQWIQSPKEQIACAGWTTLSGLVAVKPDAELDLKKIESLLNTVVKGIRTAPNRVRYTMNGFIIAVGTYVQPLLKQAKAAAAKVGAVQVEMGETACEVPLATERIEKAEAEGRIGQKRKTIRC
ncbi:MAG: DNA alkylation repair protein [Terracidiphilus sp.]|jgi:3-methyladenine DNA glycosylase AlkD